MLNRLRPLERLEIRLMFSATQTEWGLNAVQAPAAWEAGYTGRGAVVAVVDTGIMPHSDFYGKVWVNQDEIAGNGRDDDGNGFVDDVNGWDFIDNDSVPVGMHPHGTRVTGIIGAARNDQGATGVAYGATIMPIRAFDETGNADNSSIAQAIRYAVDNGADIINLSFSTISTRELESAVAHALEREVLIIAAAGNEGRADPAYPAKYSAKYPNVLSVGAFDESMSLTKTSNQVGTSGAVQIDAPGISVYTTDVDDGFVFFSGTSAAAAVVSGISALLVEAYPGLSAEQMRTELVKGAVLKIGGSESAGGAHAAWTVHSTVSSLTPELPADLDGDGSVGFGDFLRFAQSYGRGVRSVSMGDIDSDGHVGFSDFLLLANSYGKETRASIEARRVRSASAVDAVFAEDSSVSSRESGESPAVG